MTLILKTKSHGNIDAGFYSAFTKLFRLGKYAFEPKDLCDLAQYLAKNPKIKELQISCLPLEKFWEMENKYMNSFQKSLKNTNKYSANKTIDNFLSKNQNMSLEDKIYLMNEIINIPVKINDNKTSIKIGEYDVEDTHFGMMVYYLSHGGWFGWNENQPKFAEQTISAIKKSKNPLYKELQKRLS